ncbi:MAG: class I SAM-dependent methyltransferase [Actinomycetota bacterium]
MTSRLGAVAARYGAAARTYRRFWAPAMVTLSRPLVSAMPVEAGDVVADLGCGVGAIAARVAARARTVIGVDVAEGMLARAPRDEVRCVAGTIDRLPLADTSLDGAFSTFVLQHLPRPSVMFREAARALRPGGFLATATWGADDAESGGAYDVLEEVFRRHRIPPEEATLKTWHVRVEDTKKVTRLATGAGLVVERAWAERGTYRWPRRTFLGWATTMGPYGRRLASLPEQLRARVTFDLQNDFSSLPDDAFAWTPEVVYLIALKG